MLRSGEQRSAKARFSRTVTSERWSNRFTHGLGDSAGAGRFERLAQGLHQGSDNGTVDVTYRAEIYHDPGRPVLLYFPQNGLAELSRVCEIDVS